MTPDGVRKVLLCAGKVYWDLVAERAARDITDTAIVRLERLYPLPARTLPEALAGFPQLQDVRWVQEEPENQGAWSFMAMSLPNVIGRPLRGICRPASSSPATGSPPSPRGRAARHRRAGVRVGRVYFTDRGIEELEDRRGHEQVTLGWLAERLRTFVDLNPEFETPVERLSVWLARLDDDDPDEV